MSTQPKSHIVSGLIEKRAELAGIVAQLERQLDQYRADLTHIDGVLRLLASDIDPETIKPKRRYRRTNYFGRNELLRLCLNAFRNAEGSLLSGDEIAEQVIAAKNFEAADAALRAAIRKQVISTLKGLRRRGTIERIGAGRGARWRLI